MDLRQLDKKHFGRQGEPEDVIVGNSRRKFDGPDYVHPVHLYRPWAQLAEMLARITPGKLAVSYRTTGGTESVEGALQIAMAHTGRGRFVSIEGSYHGNSIATRSIGASDNHDSFKNLLPNCRALRARRSRPPARNRAAYLARAPRCRGAN